jgi:hypothetical protein
MAGPLPDRQPSSSGGPFNTPARQGPRSYTGDSKRGRVRHFTGRVTYLGGAEGERLCGELAAVIGDLLRWAVIAQHAAEDVPDEDISA